MLCLGNFFDYILNEIYMFLNIKCDTLKIKKIQLELKIKLSKNINGGFVRSFLHPIHFSFFFFPKRISL